MYVFDYYYYFQATDFTFEPRQHITILYSENEGKHARPLVATPRPPLSCLTAMASGHNTPTVYWLSLLLLLCPRPFAVFIVTLCCHSVTRWAIGFSQLTMRSLSTLKYFLCSLLLSLPTLHQVTVTNKLWTCVPWSHTINFICCCQ